MHIYLFHGKGGSPNGSVSLLERELRPLLAGATFTRPRLRHGDPAVLAEESLAALAELDLPEAAVVIGVSLGGLIAAKLQEDSRPDLTVICISSPTWADGVRLERKMERRLALYSSNDEVIRGRTAEWPALGEAHDIRTLTHDTDKHLAVLSRAVAACLNKEDVRAVVAGIQPRGT